MQNYLPHYCLNPPTAAWSQCFFLTRLYEFLGVFEQWFAGWEEASAEPEELPALGLTVPVNAKPTVLLQPHIILCLTTQPATGKRNALPSWSHGWVPWSQRAANQQSLHPGSGINLLGNNHNLDMQSQVLHEKYSWQMQTSWINIYSSLADILAAVTLVPSSWKATIDLVFKHVHMYSDGGFSMDVFTCPLHWPALLRAWALCMHWLPLTCTPVLFWKMNMLIALWSEADAVLKCSRLSWYYFSGRNPVLPASPSVKSASWSSSGTLPSQLKRALQP